MKAGTAQRASIPLYQVDVFTDKPFKGNPAAVCLLERKYSDQLLQSIAAEMNLSETAFVSSPTKRTPEKSVALRVAMVHSRS